GSRSISSVSPCAEARSDFRALLKLRRRFADDSRKSLRASAQGLTLLMERDPLLLVAALGAPPSEARLPPGSWRVALDSGAAEISGDRLRMHGRGAVVLERA